MVKTFLKLFLKLVNDPPRHYTHKCLMKKKVSKHFKAIQPPFIDLTCYFKLVSELRYPLGVNCNVING